MKPVLSRAVAIELVLFALVFLAAQRRDLHQEYSGPDLTVTPSLVRRSAYAKITRRF